MRTQNQSKQPFPHQDMLLAWDPSCLAHTHTYRCISLCSLCLQPMQDTRFLQAAGTHLTNSNGAADVWELVTLP